jgi:hypothetical protein
MPRSPLQGLLHDRTVTSSYDRSIVTAAQESDARPYLSSYSCDHLCCVYTNVNALGYKDAYTACHPLLPTKRRPQACAFEEAPPNPARGPAILQPTLQPSLQHPEPRRPPPRPLSVNCPTLSHLREHTACGRVARAASKGFALLFTPRAQGRHSYSHPEPRGVSYRPCLTARTAERRPVARAVPRELELCPGNMRPFPT